MGRGWRARHLLAAVAAAMTGLIAAGLPSVPVSAAGYPRTVQVSVNSSGVPGDGEVSGYPAVSSNGRYVAFVSASTNLVPGDTNGWNDVFRRDLHSGQTRRVSVSSTGGQANFHTFDPAISGDGRYVAFVSGVSNLVPGDTNNANDIFVHDVLTGKTRRVSVKSNGAQSDGGSDNAGPALSADGRHVAFNSEASDLVPGDTNGVTDVFVRDMATGKTRRVNVSSTGIQANNHSFRRPAISANGRHVAFPSYANNLVPGDTNKATDVFVRDLATGKTRRVSLNSDGAQTKAGASDDPSVSADGRYIAFVSTATNLVPGDSNGGVYVRDMTTGRTRKASVSSSGANANSFSFGAAISGTGRYVVFNSQASNLVPADTNDSYDVFVHDMTTGRTRRVSLSSTGAQGDGPSLYQAISADGRHVAFTSSATNLVPADGDPAGSPAMFLRHLDSH